VFIDISPTNPAILKKSYRMAGLHHLLTAMSISLNTTSPINTANHRHWTCGLFLPLKMMSNDLQRLSLLSSRGYPSAKH
jgi:hypothetical protein